MSLPETLDWCEEHEMPRCRHAWVGGHCVGQHPLDGPDVGTCRMVELRVAGRDDLLIRREDIAQVVALVEEQAEDEGLWFIARTAPEAYLQQELRRLHAVIESALAAAEGGEK